MSGQGTTARKETPSPSGGAARHAIGRGPVPYLDPGNASTSARAIRSASARGNP